MAKPLPKHPLKLEECYNFSDTVNWYLDNKQMTQADLAEKSGLQKALVSRMCRNSNDKGSSYQPTMPVVMSVSIGLKLTPPEYESLRLIAFPVEGYMKEFLAKGLTIREANDFLDEQGLPLLGSFKEES